jgi:hypothetical protein
MGHICSMQQDEGLAEQPSREVSKRFVMSGGRESSGELFDRSFKERPFGSASPTCEAIEG